MFQVKIKAIKKILPDFSKEMITKSFSDNTGGDFIVDFYLLKDGRCISVTEEVIILGSSYEDYYENFDSYEIKSHVCKDGDVIELENPDQCKITD